MTASVCLFVSLNISCMHDEAIWPISTSSCCIHTCIIRIWPWVTQKIFFPRTQTHPLMGSRSLWHQTSPAMQGHGDSHPCTVRKPTHVLKLSQTSASIHTHTRVPPPFSGSGLSPVLTCAVISVSRACLGTGRLGSPSLARRDNSYFPFDVFVFLSISINLQFMWSGWGVCCKSRHCVAVC